MRNDVFPLNGCVCKVNEKLSIDLVDGLQLLTFMNVAELGRASNTAMVALNVCKNQRFSKPLFHITNLTNNN